MYQQAYLMHIYISLSFYESDHIIAGKSQDAPMIKKRPSEQNVQFCSVQTRAKFVRLCYIRSPDKDVP